jgi:hypothetical protein
LVFDSSVGVGDYKDEGDQGSESPREADVGVGLFGLGEMDSLYVRKGLEGYKNTGIVLKFVEFDQDSRGYVGCEDDL